MHTTSLSRFEIQDHRRRAARARVHTHTHTHTHTLAPAPARARTHPHTHTHGRLRRRRRRTVLGGPPVPLTNIWSNTQWSNTHNLVKHTIWSNALRRRESRGGEGGGRERERDTRCTDKEDERVAGGRGGGGAIGRAHPHTHARRTFPIPFLPLVVYPACSLLYFPLTLAIGVLCVCTRGCVYACVCVRVRVAERASLAAASNGRSSVDI